MKIRSLFRILRVIFLFFLIFFPAISCTSDDVEIEDDITTLYVEATGFQRCLIIIPAGYNDSPSKKYTLVIGLHGRYADAGYAVAIWKMTGADGFIFVSPQGLFPEGQPGKSSWATQNPAVPGLWEKSWRKSEEYVAEVARQMKKQYRVADIYLMGHSQGAALTISTSIRNPDLFKGFISFSGWLNTERISGDELKKAKNLRVLIAHGKDDEVVRFRRATEAKEILEKYGYNVSISEYEGGHGITESAAETAGKWLKEKTAD